MSKKKQNKDKKAWSIRPKHDVCILDLDIPEKDEDLENWEQWVLVTADWHADNAHFDKKLWKKHMNLARKRDAAVFAFGDLFCAMQGRMDNRRSRAAMKKSVDHDDYFDKLVDELEDLTTPYAENMAFISPGNHELASLKFNSTNLIKRLEARLRGHGSPVCSGGIGGWIFVRGNIKGRVQTCKVAYHHGAGGGGPVTKGVIKASRRAVTHPQADIFFSGHIHESWRMTSMQEEVSPQGKVKLRPQDHVSLATYKQEYTPSESDFHTLLERPPKPLGGCWVRFYAEYDKSKKNVSLCYDLIEAK